MTILVQFYDLKNFNSKKGIFFMHAVEKKIKRKKSVFVALFFFKFCF